MRYLEGTHDLRLPAWGPYTKQYMGISHVPDPGLGLRFDLSVFPGFYRGRVAIPNVKWESGYHPWEAAPHLSYYAHRHELLWKDQVYVDISFSEVDDHARLIRCLCVNNTDLPQALVLHYVGSVHFPPLRTNDDRPICPSTVSLPERAVWVGALDYDGLAYATPRPTDNLMPDGLFCGEVRDHGFVDGAGLGRGFGAEAGDQVWYGVPLSAALSDAVLLVRVRLPDGGTTQLELDGLVHARLSVSAESGLQLVAVPVGGVPPGKHRLEIVAKGGAAIDLDGFVLCEARDAEKVFFRQVEWNPKAELLPGPVPNSLYLRYEHFDVEYGLAWDDAAPSQVRQLYADELDRFMRRSVHNHVSTVLRDRWSSVPPEHHFVNVFVRPIGLAAGAQRVLYGLVCSGDADSVARRLSVLDLSADACEPVCARARQELIDLQGGPEGEQYRFSQERMAATVLTNVVYPVYTRRTYIRHNTPGRWWDSLYTWDSGFIGLGLLELDRERAIDCLNAYLTEPGDRHAAFIHHGSPVPVQFYLFLEIWNRKPDPALLAHFYPRLKQYYLFLSGQLGSSTTRVLQSNLLKTWDYFYNSGGWDDYPPQVYVHRENLRATVAPVITTAHCIRVAKILSTITQAMGKSKDVQAYDEDISLFSTALQEYSWDEEAGYFSYVVHDRDGRPAGALRHESGVNYNRGLDGAYPLVAGICTPVQEKRLLAHLVDPNRHWTPIGLSTVDQSAPYYREDGYWNGAVWMPHQWFFWKTCLDLGRGDFAWKIARTALDVWQREVAASYNCCEHFIVATGRGAGWHHFGGLSAPVLSWYAAYFRPGRLTAGFDVWVESIDVSEVNDALETRLRTFGRVGRTLQAIVSLDPEREYVASWNGQACAVQPLHAGVFYVELPCAEQGLLTVDAI